MCSLFPTEDISRAGRDGECQTEHCAPCLCILHTPMSTTFSITQPCTQMHIEYFALWEKFVTSNHKVTLNVHLPFNHAKLLTLNTQSSWSFGIFHLMSQQTTCVLSMVLKKPRLLLMKDHGTCHGLVINPQIF